jgi:hypothetical protein
MNQKVKIYRMPLSRVFPATHPRAGRRTDFKHKMICAINNCELSCDCGWYGDVEDLIPKYTNNGESAYGEVDWLNDSRCPDCYDYPTDYRDKLHTIRANYDLWKARIDEVQEGKAVLVVYEWRGKPYSKDGCNNLFVFGTSAAQDFIDELMKADRYKAATPVIDGGIGVRKALFIPSLQAVAIGNEEEGRVHSVEYAEIAENDGLSLGDFQAWFKKCDLGNPLAIIHFTGFRY